MECQQGLVHVAQVTLHSMSFFEAAYHYYKRHNALEDATWIDRKFPRKSFFFSDGYII